MRRPRIVVPRAWRHGNPIVRPLKIDNPPSREIELGGAAQMTLLEYLARLRVGQLGAGVRPALTIAIPHWLARTGSHVCDLLHVTPYSFGHLQLMQRDNVPRVNHLPQLLARSEFLLTEKTREK